MAKIILQPIGNKLQMSNSYEENLELAEEREARLDQLREEIRSGWGEGYVERVHNKGKMTTWERLELLVDSGTVVQPLGTFVNHGRIFGKRPSPAAGVITALGQVSGLRVMLIANDNTVASGSWWPRTPEKIERAQQIALKLRIPVIYLVDCSGLYLPEQSTTFPGRTGAGHIFKMNSLLSAEGVPQIAGVFGDCIAGGGYMPIISDQVVMTERAYMVIAGAALIKGAKSQNITSLDIGGADVHVHLSHCADERAADDEAALTRIKELVAELPSTAIDYYRKAAAAEPEFPTAELGALLPAAPNRQYEVREIIARLVDDSLFWELWPELGQEMVTGIARISGLYVGIVANNPGLTPHPEIPEGKRAGGILYREGIAKVSAFSRACNADGIPLLWLQDVSGFDVGMEAEKLGLLGYGSNLIYTNSTNQTPMITVLLRKASGAGYYAMAGMPYEPVLQLSTVHARLAVMEGRTLAYGAFNTKLDDQFEIITQDPEERAKIEAGMRATEARIEADMDPIKSAAQMDTDEVVRLDELRPYLVTAVELCYQNTGTRRIKNPRIWSLHDLEVARQAILDAIRREG